MLFRNEESSLKLDIVNYEFPPDGGDPTSDDRNWLVLRATWNKEDGDVVKDSNSCLLTHELQSMTAGLKVLKAGIRDVYVSDFQEDFYFSLAAGGRGGNLCIRRVLLSAQHHGRGRHGRDYLHHGGAGAGGPDRRAGPALRKIPGPYVRRCRSSRLERR